MARKSMARRYMINAAAQREVVMGPKQYGVYTVRDEPARLREQLDHIAAAGGIVVSVTWQPARQVTLELGLAPYDVTSGHVIVSENELSEPPDK